MPDFDWTWLGLPRWTPLSLLESSPKHLVGGLYSLDSCMYALTNSDDGTADDPGVGAFMWAHSVGVALMIYERHPSADRGALDPGCPPIPAAVLGVESASFGAVMACTEGGNEPHRAAAYTFPDGLFISSQVTFVAREFSFASANPKADELAIAVRWNLAPHGDAGKRGAEPHWEALPPLLRPRSSGSPRGR